MCSSPIMSTWKIVDLSINSLTSGVNYICEMHCAITGVVHWSGRLVRHLLMWHVSHIHVWQHSTNNTLGNTPPCRLTCVSSARHLLHTARLRYCDTIVGNLTPRVIDSTSVNPDPVIGTNVQLHYGRIWRGYISWILPLVIHTSKQRVYFIKIIIDILQLSFSYF